MKKHDRLCGILWLILGGALCWGGIQLKIGGFRSPGPGFMPFLTGILLGTCGAILIQIRTFNGLIRDQDTEHERKPPMKKLKNVGLLLLILGALFTYAFLLEPMGFLGATFLFLFFLFKISEPKKWILPIVFSFTAVTLSYLLFSVWLQIPLPRGILRF